MSDDFGTISINRAKLARHREALQKLAADAPTEHLANEYRRLLGEIDAAMLSVEPSRTDAGMRPLVTTPASEGDEGFAYDEPARGGSGARVALILVAALIALGIIGGLIWMASRDRNPTGEVVEQTTTATTTTAIAAPETVAEPVVSDVLSATPASHDYGTIRKGTRATRQFEVRNASDEPVTISVARSACRCLFYEYRSAVPPKGKETVTVTIDGARAKAGPLQETVKVTKKTDPSVETSLQVAANIQ